MGGVVGDPWGFLECGLRGVVVVGALVAEEDACEGFVSMDAVEDVWGEVGACGRESAVGD